MHYVHFNSIRLIQYLMTLWYITRYNTFFNPFRRTPAPSSGSVIFKCPILDVTAGSKHLSKRVGTRRASHWCTIFCWRLLAWSILTTVADANRTRMTNTYCVYTVLRHSWWWTVDMSETTRLLYQINLRNSAYCWLSL